MSNPWAEGRWAALIGLVLLWARPSYGAVEEITLYPTEDTPREPPHSLPRPAEPESEPDSSLDAAPELPGDLVETINLEGETPPSPTPAPPSTPAQPESARFELNGWARQSFELGVSSAGIREAFREAEPEAAALPYDRLVARSQLFARARYSRGRWFEASVSGALSYSIFEQGPAEQSTAFNGFNGQSSRGVLEPRLYELYVGFFTRALDVRVGQQRLSWGRGEFISPNDVVNARDLRDPLVSERELRTLPTLMLRADLDLGFGTLQGVLSPIYTPDRFDLYGSNWAAIQPDAPLWSRGFVNLVRRSIDETLDEPAQSLLVATRVPERDLSEPVLGARFSWTVGGVDVNHYYQYGFDGPLLEVDPALAQSLGALDFDTAGLVDLLPWFAAIDAGNTPLRATYVRRHHVGADLSTTIGPIALRLDGAYQTKRVFFERNLLGVASPALQGVISLEYQSADKDKVVLVEGIYLRVLDEQVRPLLIYDVDSSAIALDLRWPLWRPLVFEVRALFGLQPETVIVQPELAINLHPAVLSLGGLWLGGEPYSLGRYFDRNRELYVKAKAYF